MENGNQRLLNSWKEIAAYLRVSTRTAQLWESDRGLPVRRVPGGRGLVWADPAEIDAWRKSAPGATPPDEALAVPPTARRTAVLGFVAAACLALAGWGVLARNTPRGDARSVPLATSPGDEWEATLSPDGAEVAYIWNGDCGCEPRNLYVKPVGGGPPRRLTNGRWRDQFPQWSPDGRWIAVGRLSGPTVEILLVSPDGAQQKILTRLESPAYRDVISVRWVTWLPDSKSVAITERPSLDDPYTIFRLSLDTGERSQLTFPPRGITGDRQCAFSPDGRYLAIVRYQNDTSSDLYLASLDGGQPRRLTHDRIYHNGLTWTPDSRALIYGAQRQSQTWGLWRLDVPAFGTAQPVRIPGVQEDASWPTLAPAPGGNAIRIAYNQSRLTVNIRRWDRIDGMLGEHHEPQMQDAAQRTVCPSSRRDVAVQYSPDGSRIAFVSDREGSREIWVCNADGSQPTKVTALTGEYTDSPRWSPDGHRLAFTTSFEENRDVWIADLRTAGLQRLTQEPSHEGRACWSSDGRWIYFRSNRSGRDEIWKTPVDGGGAAVQVTTTGAYEAFEALDGSRLYFTKSRAWRGVWSVPTSGGEETFVVDHVREGWWSVTEDAIYFVVAGEIRAYRFATGKVEPVARIPGSPALWTGFSVRPDGQSFLWCQTTRNDNDIVMLETPVP
jgi:Tol biopolymer transport system component